MHSTDFSLHRVTATDLPSINAIIERAVMTWNLPERVKRLSLPSYRYDDNDLIQLQIYELCEGSKTIGVLALEARDTVSGLTGKTALLIHGLYVDPAEQRRGAGRALIAEADARARECNRNGLLVKAQRDAKGFFQACGFQPLAAADRGRDYELRYWKPLDQL